MQLKFPLVLALLTMAATPLSAQPMTVEQFRAELVGVPLCGTPASGALEGKALCVVHLPDNTVIVAGAGILTRGIWEADGVDKICRRNKDDALERRRCVTYERTQTGYKNSDGVEACIGPCAK